jgi:hypothetical protein
LGEQPEYESSKALCRALRGREPPAADRPTPAQAAALAGCSSEDLYYGSACPPIRSGRALRLRRSGGQSEDISPYPFTAERC